MLLGSKEGHFNYTKADFFPVAKVLWCKIRSVDLAWFDYNGSEERIKKERVKFIGPEKSEKNLNFYYFSVPLSHCSFR